MVLRTRPVISIEPKLYFKENPVPLNSSGLACAHNLDYPCLEFEVCFNMTGRGISTEICMFPKTRMLQKIYFIKNKNVNDKIFKTISLILNVTV